MASRRQRMTHCRVSLFGQCGPLSTQTGRAANYAKHLGGTSISYLVAPPKPDEKDGLKIMDAFMPDRVHYAEGGILKESGQAIVTESRDCPILILEHQVTGHIAVIHAGRNQLVVGSSPCCPFGIIQQILPFLQPYEGKHLHAYVTGGISADHFEHQDYTYIKPFVDSYPESVLPDKMVLKLDLVEVIKSILGRFGVTPRQIRHDGLCTFETPWLGSRRAEGKGLPGKDRSNWTLVVKQ